jgi:hydroxymethylbilane synthase
VDVAVHSLKDLPTAQVAGLILAAVPPRESHRDVLVSRDQRTLAQLAPQSRVGTGSRRRQSQLLHARRDLRVESIRGNVDTRLEKLDRGDFDAILLAEAGLLRLGFARRVTEVLPESVMLPAVGQGALAIECRADDRRTLDAVLPLDDAAAHCAVVAERALLADLQAGCLAPVAAWGRLQDATLALDAVVLSSDGKLRLDAHATGQPDQPQALGTSVAQVLLARGAAKLIDAARETP